MISLSRHGGFHDFNQIEIFSWDDKFLSWSVKVSVVERFLEETKINHKPLV
jgi:hypothetical protein